MAVSLSLIILIGLFADFVARDLKLPGLVGMLIAGALCGPYVLDLMKPEMMAASGDFRSIALIVILLRAGFELHKDTLNRVGKTALIMSALPAIFEIAAITWIAPILLPLSYFEAAILGTILGAVSPAVVVPLMIDFMDRGRGAKKGLPTLILAASSVDDVFVIVLFTILMGMHGGEVGNIWMKLAEIPVSIGLGVLIGLLAGSILYRLFLKYDWKPPKRTIVVLGTAMFISWTETALKPWVPVAGLLGVMAIGFIILEKAEPIAHIISQKLKKIWMFAELLLFVLVGAQVNLDVALNTGLAGLGVIFFGLVFRSIGTYLSLFGMALTPAEKLFCVVSYIPKATVQAAIGAIPLAAGVVGGDTILAVAVLSILVTAPLGAFGIKIFGEAVLDQQERSVYRFKELRDAISLPRVGEKIRNKKDNTVWKVIEEKEVWIENVLDPSFPKTDIRMVPAIKLRFWKDGSGSAPGRGKTMERQYSQNHSGFDENWEILYDW